MKLSGKSIFENTRKNFKSYLVLVVVLVLESKERSLMSQWRKQVIECKKFYHFRDSLAIGRGLTSFNGNKRADFCGEIKSTMKLSRSLFLENRRENLKLMLSQNLKLSNEQGDGGYLVKEKTEPLLSCTTFPTTFVRDYSYHDVPALQCGFQLLRNFFASK